MGYEWAGCVCVCDRKKRLQLGGWLGEEVELHGECHVARDLETTIHKGILLLFVHK